MLSIKYFNLSFFRHRIISNIIDKNDQHLHKITRKSVEIASKIHFKNFHKLVVFIINFSKDKMIYLKRRFDSKQPKFFLKPEKQKASGKQQVSFFLKNVSEYKESLKSRE